MEIKISEEKLKISEFLSVELPSRFNYELFLLLMISTVVLIIEPVQAELSKVYICIVFHFRAGLHLY